jgi:hypothetical protein
LEIALKYVREGGIAHIVEKALDKGYNFALNFTLIEGLHKKLWASKVPIVPILEFWDSQVVSPGKK